MADGSVPSSGVFDDALPAPDVVRWSPKRKEMVVRAVRNHTLAIEEAYQRYNLSRDELLDWLHHYAAHGRGGLAVTKR